MNAMVEVGGESAGKGGNFGVQWACGVTLNRRLAVHIFFRSGNRSSTHFFVIFFPLARFVGSGDLRLPALIRNITIRAIPHRLRRAVHRVATQRLSRPLP
ncbi:hypothetical protein [Pseudomonas sp. 2835]|uniref:hypothetical protein n=1 Tax=Pseudomonas sp. 2835 TaxID=3156451 RepID=UPI003D1B44F5